MSLFIDPASRLWWGSLLSALVLGLLLTEGTLGRRLAKLFDARLWWHPSARLDYVLLVLNLVLKAGLVLPMYYGVAVVATSTAFLLKLALGLQLEPSLAMPVLLLVFGFTSFVFEDFSRWLWHDAQHRFDLLWRFHQVHHSAIVLTPFTLHRIHPVEMLLGRLRHTLVFGLITGVFFYLSGEQLSVISILGVDAFGLMFNFFGANLRHSHVNISYGVFERLFVSPSQHQDHHRRGRPALANLGSCFSLWDQIFGSFYPAQMVGDRHGFGLPASLMNHRQEILSAFCGPFKSQKHSILNKKSDQ